MCWEQCVSYVIEILSDSTHGLQFLVSNTIIDTFESSDVIFLSTQPTIAASA